MARPKKGTLHQLFVPMVDGTDFASIESGITESDFNSGVTKKFYGVNTGGSAATTSGTISKTGSLVRSGVFRITLKATENNYDQMMIRLSKTGCAEQIITWENVDNDDSDILSALTVIQSMASDAASAAAQANSRVLLVQSRLSDFDSRLVSDLSDVYSAAQQINSRVLLTQSLASDAHSAATLGASRALVLVSSVSDLASYLAVMSGVQSDIYSALGAGVSLGASDMSDLRSAIAAVTVTFDTSALSDIASAVWADTIGARVDSRLLVVQSQASDVYSQIAAGVSLDASTMSDLRSAVNAVTVNLTASDISDIASAVAAAVTTVSPSDISDIASAVWAHAIGARVDSRVLVVQSQASDIYSQVAAGVSLDASTMSDLRSAITAGGGATIDASSISDIASAVWANAIGARVDSRVALINSQTSDIYSLLSDVQSDFQSRVPKAVATQSQVAAGVPIDASGLSDIRSAIAATELDASDLSDIASAVWANAIGARVDSRVALVNSQASDIYSLITAGVPLGASALSDLRSAITAAELDASDLSDIASAVWARAGADPTGVVSPTGTMGAKVDWMAALARNQITQTSGVQTVYNDGLSAIASAAVSDDGSVFTRGEFT